MFKKFLATAVITMFLFGGLSTQNPAVGASHWTGPKGSLPETPFWRSAKSTAAKYKRMQKSIDKKLDRKFRKYKGYSSANLK